MNTDEIIDLSRGYVLSSEQVRESKHNDPDLQTEESLMVDRWNLEYKIRMYGGSDPLQPYYEYVIWLERNSVDFVMVLEEALIKFKDISRYKQDFRLIYILMKYISVQRNPLELYQLVYGQGLGTKCSILYKHWAEQLDKVNDFKNADRIFQLGISLQAQPEKDLLNAHLQFQLSIARRVLEGNINIAGQSNESTRSVSFRPLSSEIQSTRYDALSTDVLKREIEEGCKSECQSDLEFKVDVGQRYRQNDTQKEMRRVQRLTTTKSEFKCPVAVFEPPDPTKKPMYPKDLVYLNGHDTQLEEIRAAYFLKWNQNRKQESFQPSVEPINLSKLCITPSEMCRVLPAFPFVQETLKRTYSDSNLLLDGSLCLKTKFIEPVENPRVLNRPSSVMMKKSHVSNSDVSIRDQSCYLRTEFIEPVKMSRSSELLSMRKFPSESRLSTESSTLKRKSGLQGSEKEFERGRTELDKLQKRIEDEIFDLSNHSNKSSISALHHSPTASFTVNTRAAMNVIQKMWESPLEVRNTKVNNAVNECNLFKIPMARKSECFKMADEDGWVVDSCVNQANPSRICQVGETNFKSTFSSDREDEIEVQTNIYAHLSNRTGSRKIISAEDHQLSTLNSLEIHGERENQSVVQEALIIPLELQDVRRRFENKENDPPDNQLTYDEYELQEIKMRDKISGDKEELFDETCSTKAFAMLLPSSTPFSRPDRSRASRKSSVFNGSYIEDDCITGTSDQPKSSGIYASNNVSMINCTKNPINLSLILENSKEQGYSSSGCTVPKSFS